MKTLKRTTTSKAGNSTTKKNNGFRVNSSSRAYVQMNNLNQNELTNKLAYLVGEYQNRYWFAEKRRSIEVPDTCLNSNLNVLQRFFYDEKVILGFATGYIGAWAVINKFKISF